VVMSAEWSVLVGGDVRRLVRGGIGTGRFNSALALAGMVGGDVGQLVRYQQYVGDYW
jgi:hypothetical protein